MNSRQSLKFCIVTGHFNIRERFRMHYDYSRMRTYKKHTMSFPSAFSRIFNNVFIALISSQSFSCFQASGCKSCYSGASGAENFARKPDRGRFRNTWRKCFRRATLRICGKHIPGGYKKAQHQTGPFCTALAYEISVSGQAAVFSSTGPRMFSKYRHAHRRPSAGP